MIEGQAKCVWEVLAASWQGAAGPQLAPSAVQFAHHAKTRLQPELCKYIQIHRAAKQTYFFESFISESQFLIEETYIWLMLSFKLDLFSNRGN